MITTFNRCVGRRVGWGATAAATSTAADSREAAIALVHLRLAGRATQALPDPPDVLRGVCARPLERRVVGVRRGRIPRRTELDQVLDHQAVRAEQPNPVAV